MVQPSRSSVLHSTTHPHIFWRLQDRMGFSQKKVQGWSLPSKMLSIRNERQVDQGNMKKGIYLEK